MGKVVVFDLETRLDTKDLSPDDEQYGWKLLREGKGGISALVIYDYSQDWVYIYDENSIQSAVAHLEFADVVVGYFSAKFDVPVIEGIIGRKLQLREHLDLYQEISSASAKKGHIGRRGDFTLDTVAKRCLGHGKINSGKMVSSLIKDGRYADVFNYCAHDVKITRDVFDYIIEHKGIQGLNNSWLAVSIPEWIREATR